MTNPTPQTLANKTVMVTGSSSGIGRAIAIELAARGADIVLHGRSLSEKLKSVKREIEQLGRSTHCVLADFTDDPNFEEFVDDAWNWNQRIDCWINNAGGDVLTGDWPERSMAEKLDFLWKSDVKATLMLSRIVGQKMIDHENSSANPSSGEQIKKEQANEASDHASTGFVILNMGWDQAWQGMAGDSGELFATTKGAIMAMTKSLAQSLAPSVRVNCLAPGWIQTQWGDNASEYWNERACSESLMKRWGTPSDVASAAAFLCSDEASFISGQNIPINGGFRFSK